MKRLFLVLVLISSLSFLPDSLNAQAAQGQGTRGSAFLGAEQPQTRTTQRRVAKQKGIVTDELAVGTGKARAETQGQGKIDIGGVGESLEEAVGVGEARDEVA
ncbi:MAG TPA: hypothetical protein VJL87_03220, partial [Bdellovibrionota bacterium]|nr:hypothetical protein [Bdellovibrionota bacterium]